MILNQAKGIFFSKEAHIYLTDDGRELIGLTGLMQKHGLGADYSGIPEKVLDKAAAEGTAIHELLQKYDEGEAMLHEALVDEYREAIHHIGLKHVASEFLVSDGETVATFIDKVYATGNNMLVDLADVKTTEKVHKRALAWQLGCGKYLFERQNPGVKVRNTFCISINKKTRRLNGLVPIEPVSEAEVIALLEAERKGLIYIDDNALKDASLVIPDEELAVYVNNAVTVSELKAKIKEIEAAMAGANDKLLAYMEANNLDEMAAPGGVFKRKAAYSQTRVDSAKLKKDFPAVFQKVAKETAVKGSVTFKPNE